MTKAERLNTNGHLVWVRVADIEMAPMTWGRPIRTGDVRTIGFNLDPDLFGFPVLWERPDRPVGAGRYVVIDGQHRVRAVMDILGWTTDQIQCQVFHDIDDVEAARLSLGHQERRNLHPYDRWRTARAAGVAGAVAIEKAAANAGLTITRNVSTNGDVCAVGTLLECWERLTTPGLTRVLAVLRDAWEATPTSFSRQMIRLGMILVANYDGDLDDARLSRTLSTHAPNVWLAQTTTTRRHLGYIAQDVVAAYNTGLRVNRLDDHRSPDDYVIAAKRTTAHHDPRPKIGGVKPTSSTASRRRVRREAGKAKPTP